MRAMSSTSLSRVMRWREDRMVLFRQSATFAGLSAESSAICVMPMIPFMGVLISCDMRLRKLLLDALATSERR